MDARKNISENNLFSINDDSEKNLGLKKLKKHTISPSDNTEDESTGSTTDTNRPDHRIKGLTNGSDDQVLETVTELSNVNLNLQIQSSLKMITNIKQCIAEFENVLKATLPEKLLLENHIDSGCFKDFGNLKRKDNSFMQDDERKKRKFSRDDPDYMLRENNERISEIKQLKDLFVQNKKKINTLENKIKQKGNVKRTTNYISQSNTEYEDESDPSVFQVTNQKSSRGRHPKKLKNIKRSRGRPRKTVFMDDQISNSISEPREKKSRGRPRKSVIHQNSSTVDEPVRKNFRGRPRKNVAKDQSSTSMNEGKLDSDIEKSDFDSKKNESINSLVVGKKSRGRPKKRSTIITTKLENASNIEMNDETHGKTLTFGELKIRRSRGRPKSAKKTPNKGTDSNLSIVHRGRGRPKKNNHVSHEDATPIS